MADGPFTPDDAFTMGEGVGKDLAEDFAAFVKDRVGPVLLFVAQQGGIETLAIAKASVVQMLRSAADALESN